MPTDPPDAPQPDQPDQPDVPLRAALFLRGDAERHLARLDAVDADAVVVDLEDAVDPAGKDAARALVAEHLRPRPRGRALWVRVNAATGPVVDLDLDAGLWPCTSGVALPKLQDPAELVLLDAALARWEAARGVPVGTTGVLGMVETAAGVLALPAVLAARPARPLRLAFGPADYAAERGLAVEAALPALEHARAALVLHSVAAGLPAPLDGPWMRVGDDAGLAADSRRSAGHGFGGRLAIHPGQVPVVRAAYGGGEDLERARAVVAAWAARPAGTGSVRVGDEFVDAPVHAAAAALLAATGEADRTGERP
ncbi:HpcH/HpaI aldolase/citrate lyase family protein [Vallicoccus soli]|uniref:CoA ester lyase n=1 Tax=Vallicoccus soli TaxID=2339232 RepID=A0A3A3Z2W8_9ACTN|nr:aldolase/citrate lyase family protein [Vallicoccus soli]RJK97764.1 CoA ester lyase [Vallicoccus soli]